MNCQNESEKQIAEPAAKKIRVAEEQMRKCQAVLSELVYFDNELVEDIAKQSLLWVYVSLCEVVDPGLYEERFNDTITRYYGMTRDAEERMPETARDEMYNAACARLDANFEQAVTIIRQASQFYERLWDDDPVKTLINGVSMLVMNDALRYFSPDTISAVIAQSIVVCTLMKLQRMGDAEAPLRVIEAKAQLQMTLLGIAEDITSAVKEGKMVIQNGKVVPTGKRPRQHCGRTI